MFLLSHWHMQGEACKPYKESI